MGIGSCTRAKCYYEILEEPCTENRWKRVFSPPHMPDWWYLVSPIVLPCAVVLLIYWATKAL